ncbi:RsiV family protein [Sulfurovum sp. CS9]|uniref:RsiV family protein n=1 Tax=Sulfurovum sp. CS9 TaxID=3391146 RepID=UPI0039ED50A9
MTIRSLSFLLVAYIFTLGTNTYANSIIEKNKAVKVKTQKLLRVMDTKEAYGKSCEEYSYISPLQRLKLVKQNFLLGDILSDSLSIPSINQDQLVETNLTKCNVQDIDVSEFTYREKLSYLNENIVTIEIFQYEYGAGAAHGNSHISHYMYDREYGMKLDWENLFGKNEAFDKYVLKRVVKEVADEDFITYFKASDQLFNFRNAGYFTITNEGLLIQYGKYEITPGSSGLPSIVVPKEVLKQHMTKEMYEKCFIPNNNIEYVLNAI